MRRDKIHATFHMAVSEELRRGDEQHGEAADLYEMLAVLGEEFGELQQAVLQFDYEGGSRDHILKECIQVGAMACKTFRFITNNVTTPRRPPLQCPTCGRLQEEVGGYQEVGGYLPEIEVRFCADAFHVFGESALRTQQCPTCRRSKAERGWPEPFLGRIEKAREVPWCPDSFHE